MKVVKLIVSFAIGFLLMLVVFSLMDTDVTSQPETIPDNQQPSEIGDSINEQPSEVDYSILMQRSKVEEFVIFRDEHKPDSSEAFMERYEVKPWVAEERDKLWDFYRTIYELAPGLFYQGASDGTIVTYAGDLSILAKAGVQFIVIDRDFFVNPVYSYRALMHEMVHVADGYRILAESAPFRKVCEPKIERARAILQREGLTPLTASRLSLDANRARIEGLIRTQTGLPSFYAAHNLGECLAEVVSFWISTEHDYSPSAEFVELLTSFVYDRKPPDTVEVQYRAAEASFNAGNYKEAIEQLSGVIRDRPTLFNAIRLRGHIYFGTKQDDLAIRDMKQLRDMQSRFSINYEFADLEWKKMQKDIESRRSIAE